MAIGHLSNEFTTDPFKVSVGNKRTDSKLNKPFRDIPLLNRADYRITVAFLRKVWEDFAERPIHDLNNDSR